MRHSREQNDGRYASDKEADQRARGRGADVALPRVNRIGDGVGFVGNGDAADGKQDDALRSARSARHERVTQFVQNDAAENNSDQAEPTQSGAWILSSGLGAPHEDQQKQERQVNADFDPENSSQRNGPTAHNQACQYSI